MIYDEATKGTIRSVRNTSAMLYQLIIKITNQFYDQDDDSSDVKTKVLSFINDNYSKNIGLEEIAQFVGISKQHLCRVFKANFHTTPYEYLTLYRLKKAKEKLTNTSLTINKISQQTGFHDSSYFCQVFKKYENLSPQKFRELFY